MYHDGRAAAEEARQQSKRDAENAWRTSNDPLPPASATVHPTRRHGVPGNPYRAELEGTACTIDGAPGSLVKQGDWLERFPSTLNRRDSQPL
jgi:hypothetical protein